MLDLDYIKANTIWIVKFNAGRISTTGDKLHLYKDRDDVRDIDVAYSANQPKELREFWEDYEYANYELNLPGLYFIDVFYKEWSKDPSKFKKPEPVKRKVIGKLKDYIEDSQYGDILIENYDKYVLGNHAKDNWLKALTQLDIDFDVVSYEETKYHLYLVIQSDNKEALNNLNHISNKIAFD